jgi:hypothetical protein
MTDLHVKNGNHSVSAVPVADISATAWKASAVGIGGRIESTISRSRFPGLIENKSDDRYDAGQQDRPQNQMLHAGRLSLIPLMREGMPQ